MKKLIFTCAFICVSMIAFSQEYMQMTTIESVVPGGLGRSRLIMQNSKGIMEEIKMENFFSLVGINFENVRANDKIITEKITELSKAGWQLQHVTPGVYSTEKSTGIFITRYLFKK